MNETHDQRFSVYSCIEPNGGSYVLYQFTCVLTWTNEDSVGNTAFVRVDGNLGVQR